MFALEKTIHGHANHYPGPRGEDGDGYIPAAWVPLKDTKTRAKESQLHGAHRSEEHMMDEFQKALRPHHHNFPAAFAAYQHLCKPHGDMTMFEAFDHLAIRKHEHAPKYLRPVDKSCLKWIKRYAMVMDGCIYIPIVQYRFGLAFILGLVPELGDLIDTLLSLLLLIVIPWMVGMPFSLHLEILSPLLKTSVYGLIPIAGDVVEARIKPNLFAARYVEAWLVMRNRMALDKPPLANGSLVVNTSLLREYRKEVSYDRKFWDYVMGARNKYHGVDSDTEIEIA